jgi:hypothetical protein
MPTELGKIADMIQSGEDKKTPLQLALGRPGQVLAIISLVVCAVVFARRHFARRRPQRDFLAAVSLAVAAIPRGPAGRDHGLFWRWARSVWYAATPSSANCPPWKPLAV